MRKHGAEQVGTEIGDRAHKEAAGRAALDRDTSGVAVALAQQELRRLNEVGDGGALLHHLAGIVPWVAELAAAANVRIGDHHAAIEQRET